MSSRDPSPSVGLYLGSFGLLFAAFGISELVRSVFLGVLPDLYMGRVSLIYLPFGVEIVLAWMLGWRSLIVSVPATLMYVLFRGWLPLGPDLILRVLLSVMAAPTAMALGRLMGVPLDAGHADGRTWSRLLFVGTFGALLAQFFRYARDCCGILTPQEQLQGIFLSVFSHIAGLVVVLTALMLWFRWSRSGAIMSKD